MTEGPWRLSDPAAGVAAIAFIGDRDSPSHSDAALSALLATCNDRVIVAENVADWPNVGARLQAHPMPVVTVVQGVLAGDRLLAAVSSDIRIGSENLELRFARDDHRPLADRAIVTSLAALVGAGTASYWLLTRRTVTASEAHEAGLLQQVVPDPEAVDAAVAVATAIAQAAPLAVAYAKDAVARGARMGLLDALDLECDLYSILHTTRDRAEGVRSFLEHDRPHFEGR